MYTQFTTNRFPLGRSLVSLSALSLLLALSGQAHAQNSDVSVLFTPDTMSATAGATVNYTALFTNNTLNNLFITNATFTAMDPNFAGSFGFFNGNGMGNGTFELLANQSLSVNNVASLFLSPTIPTGTYDLDAAFIGSNTLNGPESELGSGTLHVIVTGAGAPTPEFGSVWSLGGLLLAGGMGVWSQMRRQRANERQQPSSAS